MRLIALDLDGTLLNSEKQISPATYQALERAAAQGVHVVPCTGRFYDGMPEAVRKLPFVRYAITVNGADIYDAKEKRNLHSAQIGPEKADEVFAVLDTLPVIYDCYQDGWGWMETRLYDQINDYIEDDHIREMNKRLRTPVDNFRREIRLRNRGVQKIQMFFQDMELREKMLIALQEQFPDLNVTSSLVNNIEINSREAHKGAALLELCRHLGVPQEETMAFGDGLNDITMLRTAAVGVAMDNADRIVKDAADYITDSNDHDGVAKAIEKFCLL